MLAAFLFPLFALAPLSSSHAEALTPHANGSGYLYSITHYVSFSTASTESSVLMNWAKNDAAHEDPSGDNGSCSSNYYGKNIVTILDFGSPQPNGSTPSVLNWSVKIPYTYSQIEGFVETYLTTWYADAGVCDHLTVGIGVNNSGECGSLTGANPACLANEGNGLGHAVSDVANWIGGNGDPDFAKQLQVIGGDDIESDGYADYPNYQWDSYNQTVQFINAFSNFNVSNGTGYTLLDYGAAIPCGTNCSDGSTPIWDVGEIYNAAWGLGWDEPLPEVYNSGLDSQWQATYDQSSGGTCGDCHDSGNMQFSGVISDDGPSQNEAATFWSIMGNRGTGSSTNWDTCQAGLTTAEEGLSSPCD